MSGKADPRPPKRIVDPDAIKWKMAGVQYCRACGLSSPTIDPHHLVPRDKGGDDVEANIFPLCRNEHIIYTDMKYVDRYGWNVVANGIRVHMRLDELMYVEEKMGSEWLDEEYPRHIGSRSSARGAAETGIAPSSGGTDPAPENSEPGRSDAGKEAWGDVSIANPDCSDKTSPGSEQDQAGAASAPSAGVEAPRPGTPCPHLALEPGQRCSCGYRKPHPEKKDSPKQKKSQYRSPEDEYDAHVDKKHQVQKMLGTSERKFSEHYTNDALYDYVILHADGEMVQELREFAAR